MVIKLLYLPFWQLFIISSVLFLATHLRLINPEFRKVIKCKSISSSDRQISAHFCENFIKLVSYPRGLIVGT